MEKRKGKSNKELQWKILELEAQLVHRYHYAEKELEKAGTDPLMGSGLVLRLHALGGREVVAPVLIRDGLSPETIAALQADILRSYNLATLFKPKGGQSC